MCFVVVLVSPNFKWCARRRTSMVDEGGENAKSLVESRREAAAESPRLGI
jgi:hypothetical protein